MDSPHHVEDNRTDPAASTPALAVAPTRRSLWLWLSVMAVVLGIVGAALYGFNAYRQRAMAQYFAAKKPPPTPVAVVAAASSSVPRSLSAIGSLSAQREVTVATEVAGTIASIEVKSGQEVKEGDVLVRLDDRFERADLTALQAQIRLARLTLDRAEQLRERNVTPQATLDQARAQVEQLAANVQRAQVAVDKKVIAAPFDGDLGILQIDPGQFLAVGTPLVTLTDLSRLHIDFTLPEQARASLKPGLSVEMRTDAYPGKLFRGQLTAIDPQVSAATRSITVQAVMDNPQRQLLPGMYADVAVVLPPEPDVVTVPETALTQTLYGDSVFVVRTAADGRETTAAPTVVRVLVKAGRRFQGRIAILGGLQPGALVVVSGQNRLVDGAEVAISETAAERDAVGESPAGGAGHQ